MNIRLFFGILLCLYSMPSIAQDKAKQTLQKTLQQIIDTSGAEVGLAVTGLNFKDSIFINPTKRYPMQSVYKFPLAMAVLAKSDKGKLKMDRKVLIPAAKMEKNTHSPMLKEFNGQPSISMYPADLLNYSVSKSDNNACDVLFELAGGTRAVHDYIQSLGVKGINIAATEKEMHADWQTQFTNWCEPPAMAQLLRILYDGKKLSKEKNDLLIRLMTESENSEKRIKGLLPANTTVAHKTGTSDTSPKGVIAAVNDVGIVLLPKGKVYAIVVYTGNSTKSYEQLEQLIARLSKAVYDHYAAQ